MLSGFILAHVYVGASADRELRVPAFVFILNRFFNIYPIHIITLLLTVGLVSLGSHIYAVDLSWVDSTPPPRHTMSPVELATNLIMQATLLQAWNPFYATFNLAAWSLSTLFFFYLSFPVLQEASQRTVGWSKRLGNASLSIFAIQWPLFILFIKIQKTLEIKYPLLACVHRVHECVQAVNLARPRLYYYPAYLLVTLLVSVVFQERVIAPLRHSLCRMFGRQHAGP